MHIAPLSVPPLCTPLMHINPLSEPYAYNHPLWTPFTPFMHITPLHHVYTPLPPIPPHVCVCASRTGTRRTSRRASWPHRGGCT
ncbi:hypothetical protein B484DRAFT_441168 [Ochromonadaceae sp. CCMP2298]|nr:hypothetical protein B484DRAFT_441168 [Ochromonadaceae sp. CCMP2298]